MTPTRRHAATRSTRPAGPAAVVVRLTGLAVPSCLAAALLARWGGQPGAAWTALLTPSPDPAGPVVAAAVLAAWVCTGWLAAICLLTLLAAVPGTTGRVASHLTSRCAPWAVRRTLAGVLGVSTLLAAPTAAFAEQRPTGGGPVPTAPAELLLDWPQQVGLPPADPASSAPTAAATPSAPTTAPNSPVVPTTLAVIVRPGDSLWTVAARALGTAATPAAVARAWPSWWAANREAVGPDPNVIHPGDWLQPPAIPD